MLFRSDKLQLIQVLSLGQVLDALETRTRAEQASRGSDVDEGEESYREALGRLLNVLGLELSKLVDVRVCVGGLDVFGVDDFLFVGMSERRCSCRGEPASESDPSCFVTFYGRRV